MGNARLLAILAVMALGASSAMVGLGMASGSWTVLGTGLAPGEGYSVQLGNGADRMKFELANGTEGALATFAVYGPDGHRVGYYSLDGSNHLAEISGSAGVWNVFVYKARDADLTVSVHGNGDGVGKFLPADVQRREFVLGNVGATEKVDHTYTAVLDREPVLAGLYLKGTARNLQSELRTEKGIVETVNEQEMSAAGSVIVDSKGERATHPENLQAGPFTARVTADSMSGTVQIVALYITAADFSVFDPPVAPESPDDAQAPEPPKARHKHEQRHRAHAAAMASTGPAAAECGEAQARVPVALAVDRPVMLHLTATSGEGIVTVFAPDDSILGVIELKHESDEEDDGMSSGETSPKPPREEMPAIPAAHLSLPGEYVLYARDASVKVDVLGVKECELRELAVEAIPVADIMGNTLGRTEANAEFGLELPPLEFMLHLGSPTSAAMNLQALFTGPDGEAGAAYQSFALGIFGGGSHFLPGFGHRSEGPREGSAQVDAAKMLHGAWMVDVNADLLQGDLQVYALHYLREAPEETDE